ncbi:MAG: flagellar hook assembly protein FlgD [Synergistaceae bacterium]|nr:flagellar hook assembly protein FlgD [Synergistaceae bacterium]MBQ9574819.1 flagellar hook assembly protein FlgD [Synergistaceae bacterium]
MAVTDVNSYTNLANITTTPTTNTNSSSSTSAVTSATNDTLGKDAFLKLLIAELSNQDPMNPMEDREFISQMATFSSLEQMQNMNSTLTGMAEANKFNAVQYIGKAIAFTADDGEQSVQKVAVVNHVWFDPKEGTILDTTEGEVPLEKVEGVSVIS